jgi:hypothetical protein
MQITNKASNTGRTVKGKLIPVGTVFTGRIGHYGERTFLRTDTHVVGLDANNNTWGLDAPVEDYHVVNAELVIHGYAD